MTKHSTQDWDSRESSKESAEHAENRDTKPPTVDLDRINSKESVTIAENRDTRCSDAERRNEMKEIMMKLSTQTAKK